MDLSEPHLDLRVGVRSETSVRGIFGVGDARAGLVKRVASAVGEGSVVVPAIHRFLGNLGA
jgi:thioredoxin reductase (NADPH)